MKHKDGGVEQQGDCVLEPREWGKPKAQLEWNQIHVRSRQSEIRPALLRLWNYEKSHERIKQGAPLGGSAMGSLAPRSGILSANPSCLAPTRGGQCSLVKAGSPAGWVSPFLQPTPAELPASYILTTRFSHGKELDEERSEQSHVPQRSPGGLGGKKGSSLKVFPIQTLSESINSKHRAVHIIDPNIKLKFGASSFTNKSTHILGTGIEQVLKTLLRRIARK